MRGRTAPREDWRSRSDHRFPRRSCLRIKEFNTKFTKDREGRRGLFWTCDLWIEWRVM